MDPNDLDGLVKDVRIPEGGSRQHIEGSGVRDVLIQARKRAKEQKVCFLGQSANDGRN